MKNLQADMKNLNADLKHKLNDLFLNQLLGKDIFEDAWDLRENYQSSTMEYKLFSKIIDLNIKMGELKNESTDILKVIKLLAD